MRAISPIILPFILTWTAQVSWSQELSQELLLETMKRAATYYHQQVATHGGYVYYYSLDLSQRWGEGVATPDQVWVQPPGTPTVGLAHLNAYRATQDPAYLAAAKQAAEALVYGQVQSGGWTNAIDFNPRGSRVSLYRNGRGKGRNVSSLDDGQTTSALLFLMQVDRALEFKHPQIHEASSIARDALLRAQYPCGAFPQVWDGTKTPRPAPLRANYPTYNWRTEGRIKEYWHMYTLNDNVCGYVCDTLLAAHEIYQDETSMQALRNLGDFLILAQMPSPQPGWAQQYNYEMQPIWARKFEPPGVSGDESQEAIETLLKIYLVTQDEKYLKPIPAALEYLKASLLPDGRLARYYELETNRPLYMERQGDQYSLTYDDSNLPDHYGWKTLSRLDELTRLHSQATTGKLTAKDLRPASPDGDALRKIVADLDEQGRWISVYEGEMLVGQPKFPRGMKYLSSEVFSRNLTTLAEALTTH